MKNDGERGRRGDFENWRLGDSERGGREIIDPDPRPQDPEPSNQ